MTCKTHDPHIPRTGNIGGSRGEPNDWPRCLAPNCSPHTRWGHRVPASAIHPACNRAGPYGAFYSAVHTHGPPCCPGECPSCQICIDALASFCDRCGVCDGCCPGHGKDGEDETGGQ
jgi:hypothetical protein